MAQFIPFGQPGLLDDFAQNLEVAAFHTPLLRVGKVVDWTIFEPIVLQAVLSTAKGPGGRPRFHPLLMFKVLVLQRLHGLADDQTSFQITDRHSFRAFLGLTPGDAVPDGQTIADFREALTKAGAIDRLFEVFLQHLQEQHGLALARQGVLIDATFAEVPRQRNTRAQNALIKAGEVPPEFLAQPKVLAHKDCEARWTKKNEQTFFGYKDHVKVDVVDKFILAAVVTPASVHDSQAMAELVQPGDRVAYADSAYQGAPIDADLAAKHIEPQICEKGTRGHPLSEAQKEGNRQKSKVRARVEHVFAQMRGSMKALYQRCIGLERNAACIKLSNLVYNLLRFEQIQRLGLSYPAGGTGASPA
jgi:IS5 family transposase